MEYEPLFAESDADDVDVVGGVVDSSRRGGGEAVAAPVIVSEPREEVHYNPFPQSRRQPFLWSRRNPGQVVVPNQDPYYSLFPEPGRMEYETPQVNYFLFTLSSIIFI